MKLFERLEGETDSEYICRALNKEKVGRIYKPLNRERKRELDRESWERHKDDIYERRVMYSCLKNDKKSSKKLQKNDTPCNT